MKRRHLFAFYCTLTIPIGTALGFGASQVTGVDPLCTVAGAAFGIALACLLLRLTRPEESP